MSPSNAKNSAANILKSLAPYAELVRIDKPVGILNIFFPYFYGFAFGVLINQPSSIPSHILPRRVTLILFSTFILRSMGCAWNDIIDRNIDRLVKRTNHRPMARGAISIPMACCFTAGLLVIWTSTLYQLVPSSIKLGSYAIPLIVLVIFYPFAKRCTNYAQVVLGITLGFGVLFGAAFGEIDILHTLFEAITAATRAKSILPLQQIVQVPQTLGLILLYAVYVIWTVIHDTVYAFQDFRDDKKMGIKSMAVRLRNHAKPCLSLLCILQITFLAKVALLLNDGRSSIDSNYPGKLEGFEIKSTKNQWLFFSCAVIGNAVILAILIVKVDLSDPHSCGLWFKRSSTWIGSSIGAGFTLQYLAEII